MTMQPHSTEVTEKTSAIINELKGLEGPLLPILHGQASDTSRSHVI